MKKVFFVFTLVLGFMLTKSQEVDIAYKSQEEDVLLANTVKLDVVKMIAGTSLDIGYERYISKYVSVGGNIIIGLGQLSDNEIFNYTTNFSIEPYFRGYFSEAKEYGSKGFFAEVGISLGSETVEYENYIHHNENTPLKSTGFQTIFGAGAGWKWANKGGFTFEINMGVGRRMIDNVPEQVANSYNSRIIKVIPRGGIYFGYSF